MIAASGSSTDSAMNRMRFDGLIDYAPVADFSLLRTAVDAAAGTASRCGSARSSPRTPSTPTARTCTDLLADYGVLAVEMESAALYTIAARYKARALTVLTVSDHIKTGEKTSAQERQETFSEMIKVALDTIIA